MNEYIKTNLAKYFAELALLFMTLIWGGTFVIVKESLNDVSPILFVTIRFSLASIILYAIIVFKRITINKNVILPGIFLGSIIFIGFLFQTQGLKLTSATKSGFLTGTLVVIIPLLQIIIEKKIPTRGAQIGTILVFIGVLFLSSSGNSIFGFLTDLGKSFNFGDMLTLICAIFFALHVVFIDIYAPKFKLVELLFMQLVTVAFLGIIFTLFTDITSLEKATFSISYNSIKGLLYTALLATLLNFMLQTKYQKMVTPTKAGIIYSFEPIFAALFAFFLLSEKISNFGLAGCALIFLGLIIAEGYDSFFLKVKENDES
jgi:drug/metabolite transporter (DMT)-like permease